MEKHRMIEILQEAFRRPDKKQFFFTGGNHPAVSKLLGVDRWDWTPQPTANIEPWYWNTHTIALTLGAEPHFTSDGKEWIKKLISDPADVDKIKIPSVWSGRTGQVLDKACEMLRQLPGDTLIRMPDIQSPLGVAELLWDESFYMAFLLAPESLHQLLDKITEFNIAYVNEFHKVLGNRLNACCHPQLWADPAGYYVSDDVNSMISPEQHLEFSIPYINRMTEACGPVFYHSCTWTPPYLENIKQVKNIKVANWSTGSSMDPAFLIKEFSGRFVIAPHIGIDTHTEEGITKLDKNINSAFDLVRYYIDSMQDNTTMYMVLQDSILGDAGMISKIIGMFRQKGFLPL